MAASVFSIKEISELWSFPISSHSWLSIRKYVDSLVVKKLLAAEYYRYPYSELETVITNYLSEEKIEGVNVELEDVNGSIKIKIPNEGYVHPEWERKPGAFSFKIRNDLPPSDGD